MNYKNIFSLFVAAATLSCASMGGMDKKLEDLQISDETHGQKKPRFTDIFGAVEEGDLERVKQIVAVDKNSVNAKNKYGNTPLHKAYWEKNFEMVKYLVEKGADVNAKNKWLETPLHEAAANGQLKVIEYLITNKADVNAKDKENVTPLHKAAFWQNLELVKYLIGKGADVSLQDKAGNTLLHRVASWSQSGEGVIYLVKNGAQIDIKNNNGVTALHISAAGGHCEAVQHLIERGARVDIKNNWGDTPLHMAAQNGHLEVVKVICESFKCTPVSPLYNWRQAQELLELLSTKNADGETVLDIGREETVDYLTQIAKKAKTVKNPLLTALEKGQKIDVTFAYKSDDLWRN